MSAYIAPSQIAQRQLALEGKHVLVAGEAEDLFPVELAKHCESVTVHTSNYSYYRQLDNCSSIQRFYGAEFTEEAKLTVMLYWPKAKAEAGFCSRCCLPKLGKDTEIVVVGEKPLRREKMFAPYGKVVKIRFSALFFLLGSVLRSAASFQPTRLVKTYTVKY